MNGSDAQRNPCVTAKVLMAQPRKSTKPPIDVTMKAANSFLTGDMTDDMSDAASERKG